jgi:putative redox protein
MAQHLVKIEVDYLGDLGCKVTHIPSGNSFLTDAPLDNNGKARYISPTDLLCASVAACVSTIMGMKANANGIDLTGMKVTAVKEMENEPFRRISKVNIDICFPHKLSDKDFKIMENVTKTCPVTKSLSTELDMNFSFSFAQ